jgi:hypothetical protein
MNTAIGEVGGENPTALGAFEVDMSFCKDEPYRKYRPRFAIENQDEDTTWLTDHGRRVVFVYKPHNIIDLFEFFPGQPLVMNPQRPPVYHAPTLLGARITLAQWVGAQGRTSDTYDLTIEENAERIALTVTETWQKNRQHSVKRLELAVHPRFGYVLYTTDTIRSDEPVGIELYNFLVQGLTHHHPAKRRYPFVVWRTPSHGLLKWTSNMVSLMCAGQRDYDGARNLGTDGWVGFCGEPDWNPVFAFREATGPCSIATCDNLLDEHLMFNPPSSAKGAYHLSCAGVLLALPGTITDHLVERAAFNDLCPEPFHRRLRPFCLNELCDFERRVPLDTYFRGTFWRVPENGEDWATVSDEHARSGRWALRLRVRPDDGEKEISPVGSSLWLDTGRSYRIFAHVSYRGNTPGRFRLRASQAYYGFVEQREPKEAVCNATGNSDWQRLEVTFTALPNDPAVFVQLIASGDGRWFVDDVLFEELP